MVVYDPQNFLFAHGGVDHLCWLFMDGDRDS